MQSQDNSCQSSYLSLKGRVWPLDRPTQNLILSKKQHTSEIKETFIQEKRTYVHKLHQYNQRHAGEMWLYMGNTLSLNDGVTSDSMLLSVYFSLSSYKTWEMNLRNRVPSGILSVLFHISQHVHMFKCTLVWMHRHVHAHLCMEHLLIYTAHPST